MAPDLGRLSFGEMEILSTHDQLLGGRYAFGRLDAQYRLQYASPLWGLTLIGGVAAEAGRMDKPLVADSLTGWQRSFSAYLAANTFLGPVYFGVADEETVGWVEPANMLRVL